MHVSAACVSGNMKEFGLSKAILLYKEGYSSQHVFASVHDIQLTRGGPTIQAGVAVSKSGLLEALKALAPEDYAPAELLDNRILAKGNDYLAWYVKPQKRQVWFKCNAFGETSALTDHPGLVFIVSRQGWYVYAVKSRTRPTPSTPLYEAPYFNVWADGKICTGNIETPKGAMRFNPEAWEEAFFRSFFTHPNDNRKGRLTKFRGGIISLWKALLKGRKFSNDWLVPENATLSEVFERVVKHGHA